MPDRSAPLMPWFLVIRSTVDPSIGLSRTSQSTDAATSHSPARGPRPPGNRAASTSGSGPSPPVMPPPTEDGPDLPARTAPAEQLHDAGSAYRLGVDAALVEHTAPPQHLRHQDRPYARRPVVGLQREGAAVGQRD